MLGLADHFVPRLHNVSSLADVTTQYWEDEDYKDEFLSEQYFLEDSKENRSSSESCFDETKNADTSKPVQFYTPCIQLVRCSLPERATLTDKRSIFTREQLLILRDRFDKDTTISQEEANLLASRFGSVSRSQIKTWFANMRHQKKRESSAIKIESSSTPQPPVSSTPLKNVFEKNTLRLKLDPPGPVPVSLQNALFEEFKRSSVLDPERKTRLQDRLKVSIPRIEKYFRHMSALLRGKTRESVLQSMTTFPEKFLKKIEEEYQQSRYVSTPRRDKLAHQLGCSSQTIADWFSHFRLLELIPDDSVA